VKPPATIHWEQPDDPAHMATAYLRRLTRWGAELRLVEAPPAEGTLVTVGLTRPGMQHFFAGTATSVFACEPRGHVVWVQFAEPKQAKESRSLIAAMKQLMGEPIDVATRLAVSTAADRRADTEQRQPPGPRPKRYRRRRPENWDGFEC
jgi:hypothetical protein